MERSGRFGSFVPALISFLKSVFAVRVGSACTQRGFVAPIVIGMVTLFGVMVTLGLMNVRQYSEATQTILERAQQRRESSQAIQTLAENSMRILYYRDEVSFSTAPTEPPVISLLLVSPGILAPYPNRGSHFALKRSVGADDDDLIRVNDVPVEVVPFRASNSLNPYLKFLSEEQQSLYNRYIPHDGFSAATTLGGANLVDTPAYLILIADSTGKLPDVTLNHFSNTAISQVPQLVNRVLATSFLEYELDSYGDIASASSDPFAELIPSDTSVFLCNFASGSLGSVMDTSLTSPYIFFNDPNNSLSLVHWCKVESDPHFAARLPNVGTALSKIEFDTLVPDADKRDYMLVWDSTATDTYVSRDENSPFDPLVAGDGNIEGIRGKFVYVKESDPRVEQIKADLPDCANSSQKLSYDFSAKKFTCVVDQLTATDDALMFNSVSGAGAFNVYAGSTQDNTDPMNMVTRYNFRKLKAGTNVSITDAGDALQIDLSAASLTVPGVDSLSVANADGSAFATDGSVLHSVTGTDSVEIKHRILASANSSYLSIQNGKTFPDALKLKALSADAAAASNVITLTATFSDDSTLRLTLNRGYTLDRNAVSEGFVKTFFQQWLGGQSLPVEDGGYAYVNTVVDGAGLVCPAGTAKPAGTVIPDGGALTFCNDDPSYAAMLCSGVSGRPGEHVPVDQGADYCAKATFVKGGTVTSSVVRFAALPFDGLNPLTPAGTVAFSVNPAAILNGVKDELKACDPKTQKLVMGDDPSTAATTEISYCANDRSALTLVAGTACPANQALMGFDVNGAPVCQVLTVGGVPAICSDSQVVSFNTVSSSFECVALASVPGAVGGAFQKATSLGAQSLTDPAGGNAPQISTVGDTVLDIAGIRSRDTYLTVDNNPAGALLIKAGAALTDFIDKATAVSTVGDTIVNELGVDLTAFLNQWKTIAECIDVPTVACATTYNLTAMVRATSLAGGGVDIYVPNSHAAGTLQFRKIVGKDGVTVTDGMDDITISTTAASGIDVWRGPGNGSTTWYDLPMSGSTGFPITTASGAACQYRLLIDNEVKGNATKVTLHQIDFPQSVFSGLTGDLVAHANQLPVLQQYSGATLVPVTGDLAYGKQVMIQSTCANDALKDNQFFNVTLTRAERALSNVTSPDVLTNGGVSYRKESGARIRLSGLSNGMYAVTVQGDETQTTDGYYTSVALRGGTKTGSTLPMIATPTIYVANDPDGSAPVTLSGVVCVNDGILTLTGGYIQISGISGHYIGAIDQRVCKTSSIF